MKKSQEDYVVSYLRVNKRITRNHALRQYITRLGAIVNKLNNDGFYIVGRYVKTRGGRDYEYTMIKSPVKKGVD